MMEALIYVPPLTTPAKMVMARTDGPAQLLHHMDSIRKRIIQKRESQRLPSHDLKYVGKFKASRKLRGN
jgi:hypothetical protein